MEFTYNKEVAISFIKLKLHKGSFFQNFSFYVKIVTFSKNKVMKNLEGFIKVVRLCILV